MLPETLDNMGLSQEKKNGAEMAGGELMGIRDNQRAAF